MLIVEYLLTDSRDVKHLLKDRLRILEEFCMKAQFVIKALSYIKDVTIRVREHIVFLIFLEVRLRRLHIFKPISPLNKPNKDDFFVDLGEYLDNKFYLLKIAFFVCSEEIPFNLDYSWLCCLEVPLN